MRLLSPIAAGVRLVFGCSCHRVKFRFRRRKPTSFTSSTASESLKARPSSCSTDEYSQKPFSEFKFDVQKLCADLWPLSPIDDSTVQHLHGGSSNRVIGLKINNISLSTGKVESSEPFQEFPNSAIQFYNLNPVITTTDSLETNYILRIPRNEAEPILPGVVILDYIRHHTSIPILSIVSCDPTAANPIKSPYILQ